MYILHRPAFICSHGEGVRDNENPKAPRQRAPKVIADWLPHEQRAYSLNDGGNWLVFGKSAEGTRHSSTRLTRGELEQLPPDIKIGPPHRTEAEWLVTVHQNAEWDRPVFMRSSENVRLFIDENLYVYHGNYNPYYCPGLKAAELGFRLGNLQSDTLGEILARYQSEYPPYLQALHGVSIKELADLVGKPSDLLYPDQDIPLYKWPLEYLMHLEE